MNHFERFNKFKVSNVTKQSQWLKRLKHSVAVRQLELLSHRKTSSDLQDVEESLLQDEPVQSEEPSQCTTIQREGEALINPQNLHRSGF